MYTDRDRGQRRVWADKHAHRSHHDQASGPRARSLKERVRAREVEGILASADYFYDRYSGNNEEVR